VIFIECQFKLISSSSLLCSDYHGGPYFNPTQTRCSSCCSNIVYLIHAKNLESTPQR